jgi:hypothetical protein
LGFINQVSLKNDCVHLICYTSHVKFVRIAAMLIERAANWAHATQQPLFTFPVMDLITAKKIPFAGTMDQEPSFYRPATCAVFFARILK